MARHTLTATNTMENRRYRPGRHNINTLRSITNISHTIYLVEEVSGRWQESPEKIVHFLYIIWKIFYTSIIWKVKSFTYRTVVSDNDVLNVDGWFVSVFYSNIAVGSPQ